MLGQDIWVLFRELILLRLMEVSRVQIIEFIVQLPLHLRRVTISGVVHMDFSNPQNKALRVVIRSKWSELKAESFARTAKCIRFIVNINIVNTV